MYLISLQEQVEEGNSRRTLEHRHGETVLVIRVFLRGQKEEDGGRTVLSLEGDSEN
jgi:hypothetical protein